MGSASGEGTAVGGWGSILDLEGVHHEVAGVQVLRIDVVHVRHRGGDLWEGHHGHGLGGTGGVK